MDMRAAIQVLALAGVAAVAMPAGAADFRSVAEPALLYDAPSAKSDPKFIVARGTPVEAVVTLDKWIKVRDASGELLWIDRAVLAEQRTVIVTAPQATLRKSADDSSPALFDLAKDVVLDYLEPGPAGWVKVRYQDGQTGFMRISQVWGY